MMVHEGGRGHPDRLLRRSGRRRRRGAHRRARTDPRLLRRDAADLQLRRRLLRGAREPGWARVRLEAMGVAAAGAAGPSGHRAGAPGSPLDRGRRVLPRDPAPDPGLDARGGRALHPEWQAAGGRGHLSLPRDGGSPRAVRRSGRRAVLPRGDRADRLRLGPGARRHAGDGRHGRLRARRASAGEGALPRPPRAHQPAAVLRRNPDRLLARAARAAR